MAREATLHQVQPYQLHGTPYYALVFSYADEPDVSREARLAHDAVYPDPQPDDTILVEAVLNIVTEVRKKE